MTPATPNPRLSADRLIDIAPPGERRASYLREINTMKIITAGAASLLALCAIPVFSITAGASTPSAKTKEPKCITAAQAEAAIGGTIQLSQNKSGKDINCEYDQNPAFPGSQEADIEVDIDPLKLTPAQEAKALKADGFTKVSGFQVGAKAWFQGTTGDQGQSQLVAYTSTGWVVDVNIGAASPAGAGEPEEQTTINLARAMINDQP
jgi:hypothetical protein